MREKQKRKDQESSKIECFDADLWFYDESGEFTYKVGLPAKVAVVLWLYSLKSLW
jgi:glutaminase